jgi:hypothetical protein
MATTVPPASAVDLPGLAAMVEPLTDDDELADGLLVMVENYFEAAPSRAA